jgi:hypothetical protein
VLATSIETAASSRRRRAVAVAVVGALILVVGARQLPAYDDYLGAMTKAEKIELETQSRLQTLTKNPAADQKARDSVAKSITTDVLPPWVAVRNEVARLRLPRTEHAIAAQLVQYMDLRADGWKLAAEAYRTGDLRLVKESRDKAVAALAVQARMNNRPAPRQAPDDALDAAIAAQQAAVTWQNIAQQAVQADANGVAAYNDGVRQFRARKISTTQMAQIVETQVIPPMREAHEAVAAFTPPPALKEPHDRLEAYGRLRIEAWTLRAQGLRKESADLMNQAANKDKEAAALTKK